MQPRALWRGVSGLSLTQDFMANGGVEFGCMSTTASSAIAARFAKKGQNPMLFKYETENCIERSADIAYLSVYSDEEEVLYPPLTYLKVNGVQHELMEGVQMLVVNVKATIVGN